MSLSVSGYPQPYQPHPDHHHQQHYHPSHHPLQTSGAVDASHVAGMPSPCPQYDFYSTYTHHQHQVNRLSDIQDVPTPSTAASAAVPENYFPNWMLSPPELSCTPGHIPDGYHSFGAPGANSPGGSQYQSFIQYENGVPVRCVKRRVTANKKERRRTLSINNAFTQLRGCIPNVPSDTKLSKIKTLRLATSYISYLMEILAKDDPELSRAGFKADLGKRSTSGQPGTTAGVCSTHVETYKTPPSSIKGEGTGNIGSSITRALLERVEDTTTRESDGESNTSSHGSSPCSEKKPRGRTGWPQHVWAAELK